MTPSRDSARIGVNMGERLRERSGRPVKRDIGGLGLTSLDLRHDFPCRPLCVGRVVTADLRSQWAVGLGT